MALRSTRNGPLEPHDFAMGDQQQRAIQAICTLHPGACTESSAAGLRGAGWVWVWMVGLSPKMTCPFVSFGLNSLVSEPETKAPWPACEKLCAATEPKCCAVADFQIGCWKLVELLTRFSDGKTWTLFRGPNGFLTVENAPDFLGSQCHLKGRYSSKGSHFWVESQRKATPGGGLFPLDL